MNLIKLLDIANPKTIKDTINAMIGITDTANTNASSAVTTANEAKTLSQTAATNSVSAKQTAEEALAIVEEADTRSEEASLLAEQAIADADDAVDTAELALNTANAARSAVDQALDLGQLGSFVHNTSGIALAHAYMTNNINQTDDTALDRYYVATPQLVRDALNDMYTKNEADNLLSKKADLNNFNQNINALAIAIGTGNTNSFRIFTDDADTGSYLIDYRKDIIMQAGQNNVPYKNIHFKPSGSVISHGNLEFAYGSGKTAKVPTPTAYEDATPKSYVDSISTPIGGIIIWSGYSNAVPANFLICNGAEVSRTTYATLYNLIGTTYGVGDGSTTFNLPNMVGRTAIGAGTYTEGTANKTYSLGGPGGSKDAIVVGHTHGFTGKSKSGYLQSAVSDQAHNTSNKGIFSTSQGSIGFTGGKISWYNLSINFTTDGTVNSTGSSGTDKNMSPYLGVHYIIRVK